MPRIAVLVEKIRAILLADWDPIGISDAPAAHDEYDSYIPAITGMIQAGCTVIELSGHLLHIEVENMNLRGDRERARRIAEKLLKIATIADSGDDRGPPMRRE
jgi:hypothetical protein